MKHASARLPAPRVLVFLASLVGTGVWSAMAQTLVVDQSNGNSPYVVSSGSQIFSTVDVGSTSTGTLNLNGGTLTTGSVSTLGGTSTFDFNGGTLQASASTTGFFQGLGAADVQAGGVVIDTQTYSVTVAQPIARDPALGSGGADGGLTKYGTGTLTLTGGSAASGKTLINAGTLAVPSGTIGGGSLTVATGATLAMSGTGSVYGSTFTVDGTAASPASVTVSGTGTLSVNSTTIIGNAGVGSVTQSGGTFSPSSTAGLVLGSQAGSSGSYMLSGTGVVRVATMYIGGFGSGSLVQSGGTIQDYSYNVFLGYNAGGTGTYTLSGGTLDTGATIVSANANTSSFTQSGGLHFTTGLILSGTSTMSQGTYNLNGGTLETGGVSSGYNSVKGTSTFNFNGGTLQVTNGTTSFFQGLTTANVRNGGAIVDTRGQNVTVSQSLVHSTISGDASTDGGLTKVNTGMLTMAAANTYTGATLVSAGTLAISVDGGLAKGNVSISAGATLSLGAGVSAAHNGSSGTTLTLADPTTSVFNLAGTGVQDVVGTLIINGTTEPVGTYGAAGSGAMYMNIADFTGTGELSVVPEPPTWAALAVWGMLLAVAMRCRVAA